VEQKLLGWLARYGLQAVFGLQVLGIVGLPVPDELMLTLAGTLVRAGHLPLAGTLAAAIAGCSLGITISYVAGRLVGLATLRRVLHIREEHIDRVNRWFCRSGRWLLTFGYFIPGVRHVTAIAAGSSGLDAVRFAAYAYPGAVLWSSAFVGLGYYVGPHWKTALDDVRGHIQDIAIAGLLAYAAYLLYVLVRRRRARA